MKHWILILALAFSGCHDHEDGHSHVGDDTHGHDHGAESSPTISKTIWTDDLEAFIEFPALVQGESSRFLIHLTWLDGHRAVESGKLELIAKGKNGTDVVVSEEPLRAGIYALELKPEKAGLYDLKILLQQADSKYSIDIEDVSVYANNEDALRGEPEQTEGANEISYLKEQAWQTEFQTVMANKKDIHGLIQSSGKWTSSPSAEMAVVANTSGRVKFELAQMNIGINVKKGQLLFSIESKDMSDHNLGSEIASAKVNYQQAKADYDRKKTLYDAKVIARNELELSEQMHTLAKIELEQMQHGYSERGKEVRAPFSGHILELNIENGNYVDQGQDLISLGTNQSRILEIGISPNRTDELDNIREIWFEEHGGDWIPVFEHAGKILSIGKEVTEQRPLLPVFAQVNTAVENPLGSFSQVHLAVGESRTAVCVPVSALLENYGQYAVMVQLSGERFERRKVQLGVQNGSNVEVLSGLQQGEWVVSKGAFQLKMAAMSGQAPAHGHAH